MSTCFVCFCFAGEEREKGGRRQVVREAIEELVAADQLALAHAQLLHPSIHTFEVSWGVLVREQR